MGTSNAQCWLLGPHQCKKVEEEPRQKCTRRTSNNHCQDTTEQATGAPQGPGQGPM